MCINWIAASTCLKACMRRQEYVIYLFEKPAGLRVKTLLLICMKYTALDESAIVTNIALNFALWCICSEIHLPEQSTTFAT